MSHRLPRPERGDAWALFLDFDGTLTEIAATPDGVRLDSALHGTLGELLGALDGALAVISGRPVADLDRYLAPLRLPTAGLHGLEWRGCDGRVRRKRFGGRPDEKLRRRLAGVVGSDPRLVLEDKGAALALHYRGAPEREGELEGLMTELLTGLKGYRLLCGKMVFELLPAKSGKGQAIETYMEQPPWRGRMPVFAGDDVTDEDGFEAVNALGGVSVRVGDLDATAAHYHLESVGALRRWLERLEEALRRRGPGRDTASERAGA